MADFNIDPSQVKYLKRPATKKKTTYCKESTSIVRQFFEFYEHIITNETVVFRDAGDAFKSICKTLVDDGKIGRFVEYEPCVHELLSPNDNRLHGIAKQVEVL